MLACCQSTEGETFLFKEPALRTYVLTAVPPPSKPLPPTLLSTATRLLAASRDGSANRVHLSHRILLRTSPDTTPEQLLDSVGSTLKISRRLDTRLAILEALDPLAAARECERLSKLPGAEVCRPILHRPMGRHHAYAPAPNDLFFPQQWHLENRNPQTGGRTGVDLNIRSAWSVSRGAGVVIGMGDDGVDSSHPDLAPQAAAGLQFNFVNLSADGSPIAFNSNHGTAVAGILAASANNQIGISGTAPAAKIASWVIFDQNDFPASEERLMDMFQYQSNVVAVQNHSWGNPNPSQLDVGILESRGISNAVTYGRGGRGVVMVRSAGNNRADGGNVNDDAYANNPLIIAVGAVRSDGRSTRYSNPGACLLVSAPSAESNQSGTAVDLAFPSLFTTDRVGSAGFNQVGTEAHPELADYAFDVTGFTGTSGSAPQIAGITALMLSANPQLGYRDVHQILALTSRQTHLDDPDIQTNQAGLRFSHNSGFGVPDAGYAVRLALVWSNRPPATVLSVSIANTISIPDDGLRVVVTGASVPTNLFSIPAFPSLGTHPDAPTLVVPVSQVGLAAAPIKTNLQGRGALILRSSATIALLEPSIHSFSNKIAQAAAAGASFAIIQNDRDAKERITMADTDFAPIPAVFIDQNSGDALSLLLKQHPETLVGIATHPAQYRFAVKGSILIENVGLRLVTTHKRRADLRITLVSPSGTRSIMQRKGYSVGGGFEEWTYYSVVHYFESNEGEWTVDVTDENPEQTGSLSKATLFMSGVPIVDTDRDGLDDRWEKAYFGSLNAQAHEDPDLDGSTNLLEQLLGTDPRIDQNGLAFTLSPWSEGLVRLSWIGKANARYEIRGSPIVNGTFKPLAIADGSFPEFEAYLPFKGSGYFFELAPAP